MADNVTANPASGGAIFATDNRASPSENWPISKIGFGTRDSVYKIVDTNVPLPTQEATSVTEVDASATLGNTAATAIAAGAATVWVNIQNVSTNGNLLGYTFDGSTPVISGGTPGAGTFVLLPWGSVQYSGRIPSAALKIIGSAASTVVTIKYA
jgi:hypothetical protein